ncbi:MAG: tripartite tricarboxylate transporter substrate binding protein, partial [Acetobacteraceae bacterium]|nr:tripartite tricarboxylate transporter substrate binding protein [Acetobacteraceae bacterium]
GLAFAIHAPRPSAASDRPSRLVVPVPPGTSPDTAARLLAERLSHRRGHPLAVENRVGGDGTIGAAAFAQARPGEALFFGMADLLTVAPLAGDPLPYDPAADFAPVSSAATDFFVLSVPSAMPVRTLAEFVDHARARPPGELSWAGPARTAAYPAFRAFLRSAGLEMAFVPYRGGPQALLDLAEGRIQAVVSTLAAALGAARGGKARMLATAARTRAPAVPDLPTTAEAGFPDFRVEGLLGLFGWRGMPEAVRDGLSAQVREVLLEPAIVERFGAAGMQARGSTAAAFAGEIAEHRRRWAALAREFGVGPPHG